MIESLVCPEQLNYLLLFRKILQLSQIIWFSSIFVCIWTLSINDCMILRSIFSHRGQLRDSFATITEDSNAHWCSRKKETCIKRQGVNTFEQNEDVYIFLVLPKYLIFLQATEDSYMFSSRQIKLNSPRSSNSKRFHAPALNAWFFLLEHQWSQNHTVIDGKCSNTQKCWK